MNVQVANLSKFLTWVEKCPYTFTISSMSGGFVHVKFFIPVERAIVEQNLTGIYALDNEEGEEK